MKKFISFFLIASMCNASMFSDEIEYEGPVYVNITKYMLWKNPRIFQTTQQDNVIMKKGKFDYYGINYSITLTYTPKEDKNDKIYKGEVIATLGNQNSYTITLTENEAKLLFSLHENIEKTSL